MNMHPNATINRRDSPSPGSRSVPAHFLQLSAASSALSSSSEKVGELSEHLNHFSARRNPAFPCEPNRVLRDAPTPSSCIQKEFVLRAARSAPHFGELDRVHLPAPNHILRRRKPSQPGTQRGHIGDIAPERLTPASNVPAKRQSASNVPDTGVTTSSKSALPLAPGPPQTRHRWPMSPRSGP